MKYGLTRNLHVYNIQTQKGEVLISAPGDYLQSQLWCQKHLKGLDDGIADLYQTFAWAWHALKRNGKLEEYGLSPELTVDALTDMADTVSVYMEVIKDDALPLAGSGTQQTK